MNKNRLIQITIGISGLVFAYFTITERYRDTAITVGMAFLIALYVFSKINQVTENASKIKETWIYFE